MEYHVIVTQEAELQIENIHNFLLFETKSKSIADNIFNWLYVTLNSLKFMPEIHPIIQKNFRSLNYKSYKIFYKISKTEKTVIIYHIFSQSQNFINYL